MHDLQSQLPSGGFSKGGDKQYMWNPKSRRTFIINTINQKKKTHTSVATVTKKKSFIIFGCSTDAATFTFNTLPTVFFDRNDHVFCELKTCGMPTPTAVRA